MCVGIWGETTTWGRRSLGISGEEPEEGGIGMLWGDHSSGRRQSREESGFSVEEQRA